jgi:alpha-tubulin suppressor-like RCC1 family protein
MLRTFIALIAFISLTFTAQAQGDVSRLTATAPTPIIIDRAVTVASGRQHSCAITVNGNVRCWGRNGHGQLGDGTNTDQPTPTQVKNLTAKAIAISAGDEHTCIVTEDYQARCWGRNDHGQLGTGSIADRNVPQDINLNGDVIAISAAAAHTCALIRDGGVNCWGDNSFGQLGDGTTELRLSPVTVGNLSNAKAISAGGAYADENGLLAEHTCALIGDDLTALDVSCWGSNQFGQIALSVATNQLQATQVITGANAIQLSAGGAHTCILLNDHRVQCWGLNNLGQLGDGSFVDRATPTGALIEDVQAIDAGSAHTCALLANGTVKCWGNNLKGQLGDATTISRASPVSVLALNGTITDVSVGESHSCAVMQTGAVRCWGSNTNGQFGNATDSFYARALAPTQVLDLTTREVRAADLALGATHSCAHMQSGIVACWGENDHGQLGNGNNDGKLIPVQVIALDSGSTSLTSRSQHTCAVTPDRIARCWGINDYGQLGDGTRDNRFAPVAVSNLANVRMVSAGTAHTCAATYAGDAYCWGDNTYGQAGGITETLMLAPKLISGVSGVTRVAAGAQHTCALTVSGSVHCWGNNQFYQLGNPIPENHVQPSRVVNLSDAIDLVAGALHTCALRANGAVICWGYNSNGQLGNRTTTDQFAPVSVIGISSQVVEIAAGEYHTCARTIIGEMWCWGNNTYGQLGDSSTSNHNVATLISTLTYDVAHIAAGQFHTCATLGSGKTLCWGRNERDQLGINSTWFNGSVTMLGSGVYLPLVKR